MPFSKRKQNNTALHMELNLDFCLPGFLSKASKTKARTCISESYVCLKMHVPRHIVVEVPSKVPGVLPGHDSPGSQSHNSSPGCQFGMLSPFSGQMPPDLNTYPTSTTQAIGSLEVIQDGRGNIHLHNSREL